MGEQEKKVRKDRFVLGNNKRLGKSLVTSYYRAGYDELVLSHDMPGYERYVQKFLGEETMGYEIISHTTNRCTIQDLAGTAMSVFDNVLRRIWFLVLGIAEDLLNCVESADHDGLRALYIQEKKINILSNYCIRTLIKQPSDSTHLVAAQYRFTRNLEEIADTIKDLGQYLHAKEVLVGPNPAVSVVASNLKKSNGFLNEFYAIYYQFSPERTERLMKDLQDYYNSLIPLFSEDIDSFILHHLFEMSKRTRNLVSNVIEIQIA